MFANNTLAHITFSNRQSNSVVYTDRFRHIICQIRLNLLTFTMQNTNDICQVIFLLCIGVRYLVQRCKQLGIVKAIRACVNLTDSIFLR
ncbi:hypothetical protein D3C77_710760 [compost metagenome]